MSDSLWPHGLFCPWNFPGKNTGVGCHFFLLGIFPTQGSNSCLLGVLHCGQFLYRWAIKSHQGAHNVSLSFISKADRGHLIWWCLPGLSAIRVSSFLPPLLLFIVSPLQWNRGVLTIGPPGNFPLSLCIIIHKYSRIILWDYLIILYQYSFPPVVLTCDGSSLHQLLQCWFQNIECFCEREISIVFGIFGRCMYASVSI